jgi:hypothetical protein
MEDDPILVKGFVVKVKDFGCGGAKGRSICHGHDGCSWEEALDES